MSLECFKSWKQRIKSYLFQKQPSKFWVCVLQHVQLLDQIVPIARNSARKLFKHSSNFSNAYNYKKPSVPHPALISSVGCRICALSSGVRASCCVRRKWRAAPISSTVIMAGWVSRRGVSWREPRVTRRKPPERIQRKEEAAPWWSSPWRWWRGDPGCSSSRPWGRQPAPASDAQRLRRRSVTVRAEDASS